MFLPLVKPLHAVDSQCSSEMEDGIQDVGKPEPLRPYSARTKKLHPNLFSYKAIFSHTPPGLWEVLSTLADLLQEGACFTEGTYSPVLTAVPLESVLDQCLGTAGAQKT